MSPEQSFQPEGTEQRRANLCPMPSETGAWDSLAWKRWLSLVREGQILVPAVTWQVSNLHTSDSHEGSDGIVNRRGGL